jgi:hypothetical protein
MTGSRRPKAPESLDAAGKRLWASVVADYELSALELEILRQCCRTADLLARIDVELMDCGFVVEGRAGQPRPHPLLTESAAQRRVLDVLLRSLNLPMPDEQVGRRRSPSARVAAQERWRRQGPA